MLEDKNTAHTIHLLLQGKEHRRAVHKHVQTHHTVLQGKELTVTRSKAQTIKLVQRNEGCASTPPASLNKEEYLAATAVRSMNSPSASYHSVVHINVNASLNQHRF